MTKQRQDYLIDIGKRIKQRRLELGMSQEELATKCGYKSRSTINKIELGVNDIPQSKINAFAVALNTTPSYILGFTEKSQPQLSQQKQEFIKRVESMSDEQLDILEKLLDLVENKG